ncbi:putative reverse transcriptase domain protein [Mycena venus]|uniref:Putative reverse transcriptase domain protein n=1 Tax=Mycena venus TaxID=2733690 RepID=A0A8H6X4N8_9AGAR|nr:putative reverse transcriptase domain protein [Mycena venus]
MSSASIARAILANALKTKLNRPTVISGSITKKKIPITRRSNRRVTDDEDEANRPDAKAHLEWTLQHAWSESTLEKYGSSLAAFHEYCDKEGVSVSQRLPANEFLLCTYASSRVGEIAGRTARSALAAVKAWHTINGAEWRGGIRLRYTLRAVKNMAPSSSKRPMHPPVSATMVDILGEELNHEDPFDSCVYGTAAPSSAAASPLLRIFSHHVPRRARAGLHLPWTKTKGKKGDLAMLCRQFVPSDPVQAVENTISVNNIPADQPLFSYRTKNGGLICLTRRKFLKRCNEIWSRHGFPAFTGHSFRIGGTTELLLAGVHPDVVQVMGRWQSDAYKVYWRRMDILSTVHWEGRAGEFGNI